MIFYYIWYIIFIYYIYTHTHTHYPVCVSRAYFVSDAPLSASLALLSFSYHNNPMTRVLLSIYHRLENLNSERLCN